MNQHYIAFTIDDFIADEQFQQYILLPDPVTEQMWQDWFLKHPDKKIIADEAAAFLLNIRFSSSLPDKYQTRLSLNNNLQHIASLEKTASEQKNTRTIFRRRTVMAIAASVMLCIASTAGWFLLQKPDAVMVELVTGPGEVKTVLLPDSSSVTINENSSVSYSSDMREAIRRELWMTGEAFFNIRHIENPGSKAQRFVVYSGDLQVEVLGTAFNVKTYKSLTNVTLNTGQIKIGVKNDPVSVTLQPGDFIQYSEKDKKLVKRKVDAGLYSTWKEKKLKLDKMPMKDIAQLIHDIYGYEVQITDPTLRTSQVSGTLLVNDEATFLQTLAFALDLEIEKQDSILRISSKTNNKKE